MVVDALLAIIVLRYCWHWPLLGGARDARPVRAASRSTFLAANSLKIAHGGWMPILLRRRAGDGDADLATRDRRSWRRRRAASKSRCATSSHRLDAKPPHRVPGTAIFLTGNPDGAPTALLHNLKHNKIIHERNIIMTIRTEQTPRVLVERARRRSSELSPILPARSP